MKYLFLKQDWKMHQLTNDLIRIYRWSIWYKVSNMLPTNETNWNFFSLKILLLLNLFNVGFVSFGRLSFFPREFHCELFFQYLGNLKRVSGVDCLDAGKSYKIPLFVHHSLVFPGEQFPMMIPSRVYENAENAKFHHEDGCLFGLVFPSVRINNLPCGVTCQIYEKGDYKKNNIISIKSKAYQRFIVDQQASEMYGKSFFMF